MIVAMADSSFCLAAGGNALKALSFEMRLRTASTTSPSCCSIAAAYSGVRLLFSKSSSTRQSASDSLNLQPYTWSVTSTFRCQSFFEIVKKSSGCRLSHQYANMSLNRCAVTLLCT